MKILVIEDEIIIADNICEILTDLGYEVSEPAISYSEAAITLKEFEPDIAIVDINLSGKKDGIDLAQLINNEYNIPFIFLTSNTDTKTVERAKNVSPWAYLVKPFNKDELYTSIEIALSNFENQRRNSKLKAVTSLNQALFIKQKHLFIKVKFDDILYIKADHVYIEIISKDNHKFLVRGSLNDYILKLNNNFSRVHRSFIVNLQHIISIDQDYVKIEDHQVPIGKKYREELLNKINLG